MPILEQKVTHHRRQGRSRKLCQLTPLVAGATVAAFPDRFKRRLPNPRFLAMPAELSDAEATRHLWTTYGKFHGSTYGSHLVGGFAAQTHS